MKVAIILDYIKEFGSHRALTCFRGLRLRVARASQRGKIAER